MKLHFEDNLDCQLSAINAVANIFKKREISRAEFTVNYKPKDNIQGNLGLVENELGIGNRSQPVDDEILNNMRSVQLRGSLRPADSIDKKSSYLCRSYG